MSYILDALRKADAERARGMVPGIHAQPAFGGPAPVVRRRGSPARIAAVLAGVAVAGAAVGWFVLGDVGSHLGSGAPAGVATPPATVAASPQPAPAVPPAVATSPTAAPTAAPPTAPPVAANPAPAAAMAAAPAAPSASAPAPSRSPRPRPAPAVPADGRPTLAHAGANSAPPGSKGDADARVYALHELPEEVRRALPTLNVGGSMYSDAPRDRLLILNGMVMHEGDKIGPEVQLLQIRLKSAVLSFRGYRYEITY